jgi:hypothetical protein
MVTFFALCRRDYPNAGPDRDKTYKNVLSSVRQSSATQAQILQNAKWGNPAENEYVIWLTEQQFNDFNSGINPLYHDGIPSLPRWQNENAPTLANTAGTTDLGSFADPENDGSVFTTDQPLQDDRWIVRIYDGPPQGAGVHIAEEGIDEDTGGGQVVRYLKLFNKDDVASTTNASNQQVDIGGRLMIFDFTNGVTTFNVETTRAGAIYFPSNHRYRLIGPASENYVKWQIFGRTLTVN